MFRSFAIAKPRGGHLGRYWIALAVILRVCPLPASENAAPGPFLPDLKSSVIRQYADVVYATYHDAWAGATNLQSCVQAFLHLPSKESMARARQAWVAARRPYLQSEVFRFYDGPIDEVEGWINAWPIDEALIDYVIEDPSSGIINHPERYPGISCQLISDLNEKAGERSITTGFHAIEFLLWGQDQRVDGPGDRSWKDYTTGTNAPRRAAYLRAAAELLVGHLRQVTDHWSPERPDNYRAGFLALPPDAALGKILKGLGSLSGPELSGERLTVAYQTKEQEDEHSCFSDTTDLDLRFDALGIENVYLGRYRRVDGSLLTGPGIRKLVEEKDASLARLLDAQIGESFRAAAAIPPPFDQAILGKDAAPGRVAINRAAKAFQAQADTIAKAAAALGIAMNF
ncbi:MAG TPA: imelysin family protein [Verrucomicrobiae bacterium]|nr:imelysin family protein [Verrucomicrobiae bacterium]